MRAVAFDAMGALYRSWDDLADLVIPFAREHGSSLTDAEIGAVYRRASSGALTSGELWADIGVSGEPSELDRAHLARHRVVPGIIQLLDELQAQGVWLGCISNDVAEWSRALRIEHGLDRRITQWTVSGEVGARKPVERIFQAFLATSGFAPEMVTFIDDRPKNIGAASALGFRTILVDFAGVGSDAAAVRTIAELRAALDAAANGPHSPQR